MQLTVESHDGHQLVRVSGELDTFAAQTFRKRVGQLVTAEATPKRLGAHILLCPGQASFYEQQGLEWILR